jgi:radical SAM superfamily enzyme YgiQ (UPF0313 family)
MQNNQIRFAGHRDFIQDLNRIPMPAYDLIDIKMYPNYFDDQTVYLRDDDKIHNLSHCVSLIFGRGCHYNCKFCSSKALWKRTFRIIEPRNAVGQIKYFYDQGTQGFAIWDDHLLLNKEWFNEFYRLLKIENLNIYFKCLSRVDSINQEIACKLRELGCVRITLGIENGSSSVLKSMNKKITTLQAEEAVRLLFLEGIVTECGPILNMPGETDKDINETLIFFKKLEDMYKKTPGMPITVKIYPGSDLENYAIQTGYFQEFSWTRPYYEKRNLIVDSNPHVPIFENIKSEELLKKVIIESINTRYTRIARALLFFHLFSHTGIVLSSLLSSFKHRFFSTGLYLVKELFKGGHDYLTYKKRIRKADKIRNLNYSTKN